jgi:hypothetical protein
VTKSMLCWVLRETNWDSNRAIPIMASGTDIALCARNILRLNTKACGDDAAAYRPEYWLEAGPERLAVMEEAFHLVFGFDRTRCIGENS